MVAQAPGTLKAGSPVTFVTREGDERGQYDTCADIDRFNGSRVDQERPPHGGDALKRLLESEESACRS
jgi:hypothetical protein